MHTHEHTHTHTHTHTCAAIPKMITLANDLINNPSSQTARNQFVLSLREILESIHQIQSALHSRTTTGKPAQIMGDEAHKTSTPLPSAQEKRQMEQLRTQSRYIGSLAATQRVTRQRMLPTPPRKVDGGVQVTKIFPFIWMYSSSVVLMSSPPSLLPFLSPPPPTASLPPSLPPSLLPPYFSRSSLLCRPPLRV